MESRKVLKRIVTYVAALAMLITTMTGLEGAVSVKADTQETAVKYMLPNLSSTTVEGVYNASGAVVFNTQSTNNYTVVSSGAVTWTDGVYVVNSNVGISSDRVTVSGNVTLVLCDGTQLQVNKGIGVPSGSSLTICVGRVGAEAEDIEGTGTLSINGVADNNAAIGGTNGNSGNIIICGGTINATGGESGAGIGGGYNGSVNTIAIYGGTISKARGRGGAGIGSGYGGRVESILIYGGVLEGGTTGVYSNSGGAGIGCGISGTVGIISITGGQIGGQSNKIECETDSSGIGCGNFSSTVREIVIGGNAKIYSKGGIGMASSGSGTVQKVTISGGTIDTENIGYYGAGISGDEIEITGGNIKAKGTTAVGSEGPGIYGRTSINISNAVIEATGQAGSAGIWANGSISITGSTVTSTGDNNGAGIQGATVTISNANVTATGGSNEGSNSAGIKGTISVSISGGTVNATGHGSGAGISGGTSGTEITITGGNVTLSGGGTQTVIVQAASPVPSFTAGTASTRTVATIYSDSSNTTAFTVKKNGAVVTESGISAVIEGNAIKATVAASAAVGTYKLIVTVTPTAGEAVTREVCDIVINEPAPVYYPPYIPYYEPEPTSEPEPTEAPVEEPKKEEETVPAIDESVPEDISNKILKKVSKLFGTDKVVTTYSSPAAAAEATRKGKTYYDENGNPVKNAFVIAANGEIRYTDENGKYVKKRFVMSVDKETNTIVAYYVGKKSYLKKNKTFTVGGVRYKADKGGVLDSISYKIDHNGKVKKR